MLPQQNANAAVESKEPNLEELEKLLVEGFEKCKSVSGKDLVLVIGATGAGKSTTVDYLTGCRLQPIDGVTDLPIPPEDKLERYRDFKWVIAEESKNGAHAVIGKSYLNSTTLIPEVFKTNINDQEIYYCDCPGFFDSNGQEQRIANSIFTELAVRSAKSIKAIMILIEESQLKGTKGALLKKLGKVLSKLFNENVGNQIGNSLCFVITKTPENAGLVVKGPIDEMLRSGTLSPTIGGSLRQYVVIGDLRKPDGKNRILGRLSECVPIPKEQFNFQTYDLSRKRFEKLFFKIAGDARLIEEASFLPGIIEDDESKIEELQATIKSDEEKLTLKLEELKKVNESDPLEVLKKQLIEFKEQQAKVKAELASETMNLDIQQKEARRVADELKELRSQAKERHEYEKLKFDKHKDLNFFERVFKRSYKFKYTAKYPIIGYEEDPRDSFDEEKRKIDGCYYECSYKIGKEEDAKASVKLFIAYEDSDAYKARMDQLIYESSKIQGRINELDDLVKDLQSKHNGLQQKIDGVNTDVSSKQVSHERSYQLLQELIKVLEATIAENKKRVGELSKKVEVDKKDLERLEKHIDGKRRIYEVVGKIARTLGYGNVSGEADSSHNASQKIMAYFLNQLDCLNGKSKSEPEYCPITKKKMADPVYACKNKHTFERTGLEAWFISHPVGPGKTTCPCCREIISKDGIMPNQEVRWFNESFLNKRKQTYARMRRQDAAQGSPVLANSDGSSVSGVTSAGVAANVPAQVASLIVGAAVPVIEGQGGAALDQKERAPAERSGNLHQTAFFVQSRASLSSSSAAAAAAAVRAEVRAEPPAAAT